MTDVDVVFLSWAKDDILHHIMRKALQSLSTSERDVKFHVYVVESNKEVNYDEFSSSFATCKTLHPDVPFGYHRYMNIGVREGSSPYVVLCNSDVLFHPNWASAILQVMKTQSKYLSASPRSMPKSGSFLSDAKPVEGYAIRKELAGWCIFQQRKIYDILGQLDERFIFWYADNDYAEELKQHKLPHCLVPTSRVDHHHTTIGRTGASLHVNQFEEYTKNQQAVFVDKWGFKP